MLLVFHRHSGRNFWLQREVTCQRMNRSFQVLPLLSGVRIICMSGVDSRRQLINPDISTSPTPQVPAMDSISQTVHKTPARKREYHRHLCPTIPVHRLRRGQVHHSVASLEYRMDQIQKDAGAVIAIEYSTTGRIRTPPRRVMTTATIWRSRPFISVPR